MKQKGQIIKKLLLTTVLLLLCGVGITYAVGRNATPVDDGKMQVVASYYPLYDFARQVGGDKVQVINMTPAGVEPHDYEPSAKALAQAQSAQVFIYNGGHMEPWAGGFLHSYTHIAGKASQGIALLHPDSQDDSAPITQDPHFWLDPVLAQKIVDTIRDSLSKADPMHKTYYAQNAAAYKVQLAQLDSAYRQGLSHCASRTIISSHDAFSYVGKRYNLNIVSIAGLSPEEEPSAAKLAELSKMVQSKGIRYVFFESLASPRLADTIAREAGAKTLVFDPIEGLDNADQQQGKNYLSIQRQNLTNLRTALACQ